MSDKYYEKDGSVYKEGTLSDEKVGDIKSDWTGHYLDKGFLGGISQVDINPFSNEITITDNKSFTDDTVSGVTISKNCFSRHGQDSEVWERSTNSKNGNTPNNLHSQHSMSGGTFSEINTNTPSDFPGKTTLKIFFIIIFTIIWWNIGTSICFSVLPIIDVFQSKIVSLIAYVFIIGIICRVFSKNQKSKLSNTPKKTCNKKRGEPEEPEEKESSGDFFTNIALGMALFTFINIARELSKTEEEKKEEEKKEEERMKHWWWRARKKLMEWLY